MSTSTQKKYRILLVTGRYPTARAPHSSPFVKSHVDSLIAAGHEVEVIHPNPDLPMPVRYASASVQVFLKTITGRFDIVHGFFGLWCLVARLQWTIPVVASFLGDDLLGELIGREHYSKKGAFVVWVSRWLCRVVDAVIVENEEMKRLTSREDTSVIPCGGVNFELFHPMPRAEMRAALGWDQHKQYVLFGGNPRWPRKRLYLAQEAMDCLRARGVFAELIVVEHLPHTQIVQYINASNAVILPSVHEGSPNFVREATACNVPVVVTKMGDVVQLIGRTSGCSVCQDDPVALADGLEKALQHTEPTTGRADIAYLERSKVAKQVVAVYERASERKHWLSRIFWTPTSEPSTRGVSTSRIDTRVETSLVGGFRALSDIWKRG